MKNKYFRYIDKNIKDLSNKVILISGATGSIGSSLCIYLSKLNNELILLARNVKEGEKLKEKLKVYKNKVEIIYFDYLDKDSLIKTLDLIKNLAKVDLFINVSGIYHQTYQLIDNVEKTYIVNYLAPSFFITELLKINPNLKIIVVTSLTANVSIKKDININEGLNEYINSLNKIQNKTKRYALSKHLLMSYLSFLIDSKNAQINFAHPGVSCTNLFNKKNKAYFPLFYYIAPPLMKLLFMSPDKAALSILYACSISTLKDNKRIGPRGLFHAWGYPKVYNFNDEIIDKDSAKNIYKLTIGMN